jgi:hypothetical protein
LGKKENNTCKTQKKEKKNKKQITNVGVKKKTQKK